MLDRCFHRDAGQILVAVVMEHPRLFVLAVASEQSWPVIVREQLLARSSLLRSTT